MFFFGDFENIYVTFPLLWTFQIAGSSYHLNRWHRLSELHAFFISGSNFSWLIFLKFWRLQHQIAPITLCSYFYEQFEFTKNKIGRRHW